MKENGNKMEFDLEIESCQYLGHLPAAKILALLDKDTDDLPCYVFLTDTKQKVPTNKHVHAIQHSDNWPISPP